MSNPSEVKAFEGNISPRLSAKEIWKTLAGVDVSENIDKKGKLSYLSWAWAWGILMEYYPEAEYQMNDERYIGESNPTAEVSCRMTIGNVQRTMWLPVLDHVNKPIMNPNAFQINTAKMRCLTKCIGMFGLGHYIYAGEDLPPDPPLEQYLEDYEESIMAIKTAIASDVLSVAAEEWFTLPAKVKEKLWISKTNGGPFDQKEKSVIGSTEFREAYYGPTKEKET